MDARVLAAVIVATVGVFSQIFSSLLVASTEKEHWAASAVKEDGAFSALQTQPAYGRRAGAMLTRMWNQNANSEPSCSGWDWLCSGGPAYAANDFKVKEFEADKVEHVLAYSRNGSAFPESIQGIWWMDSWWGSSIPYHNEYRYNETSVLLKMPASPYVFPDYETVISFGGEPAEWHPETRTVKYVTLFGGKDGHWACPSNFEGRGLLHIAMTLRMSTDFTFENSEMTKIYFFFEFQLFGIWFTFPRYILELLLIKKDWGWDRLTTVFFVNFMHYPFIQIVDGNGKRTKIYDEYLQFLKDNYKGETHLVTAVKIQ